MKERSFDEMIAYFNRRVSEMDIARDYKIELLGMIAALGYKHEKTAQPELHEIGYFECANSTLKMWIDNVLTDGEYSHIMDKLNAYWAERRADGF